MPVVATSRGYMRLGDHLPALQYFQPPRYLSEVAEWMPGGAVAVGTIRSFGGDRIPCKKANDIE